MAWEYPLIDICILILALAIDLFLGDPPWKIHPTFLLGELTKILERRLRHSNPLIGKVVGFFLVLLLLSITIFPTYFCLKFIRIYFGFVIYALIAAIILKLTLCIKLETKWALAAARAIETGNLPEARSFVPYFSRRNEKDLSAPLVVSAIIESIAENLPDFKLSQIFYYSFFSIPGAIMARVVNTMDSVIGFKNAEHMHTGWFTAKFDTLINYIPARLTTVLIVLASAVLGEDWKSAWRIALRDWKKIPSTNHGWPVAAMAGALHAQFEKPNYYRVGDEIEELSPNHIIRALRIRNMVIILCILLLLPVMVLTRVLFFFF